MSSRPRHASGQHYAGPRRPAVAPAAWAGRADRPVGDPQGFDVEHAYADGYDFARAFDDLDDPAFGYPYDVVPAPARPVRPTRSRVAFAMAVTAVALPLLVVDNLGARADADNEPTVSVAAEEAAASIQPVRAQLRLEDPTTTTIEVTTTTVPTTVAHPLAAAPTTTVAPTTTTEAEPPTAPVPAAVRQAPAPTTTTTAPAVRPAAPAKAPAKGDPNDPATWDAMAECEAGGNWAANTGNGYYGGLQFSQASWENVGGTGMPHEASRETQIEMGKRLQARQGWAAWPTCSRELGYL